MPSSGFSSWSIGSKSQWLHCASQGSCILAAEFWAVVAALLTSSLLLLRVVFGRRGTEKKKLPPGPFAWPVIGNLLELAGGLPHRRLAELATRYGPVLHLKLGSKHAIVASSASAAREFLQVHDRSFASRPKMASVQWISYGQDRAMATGHYGNTWRHLRRLCMLQLFTAPRVVSFRTLRTEEVASLIHGLVRHANADELQPVDLTACIGTLIENTVCRILVSQHLTDIKSKAVSGMSLMDVVHRTVELSQVPIIGDYLPWLGFLDYKLKRAMHELHLHYDMVFEDLIQEREKRLSSNVQEDFLDVLMSSESALDRDGIKAVLLEMIAAGIDTTSVTIDWAMAEILSRPEILQKLQQELDKVVGLERMVEEDDLSNLPLLNATIRETLRLHPPLPLMIPHMAPNPSQVANFSFPSGTILLVNVWAVGRDPLVWDQPNKFIPKRFLEQEKESFRDVRGQHYELLPFGSGRRSCPGLPLALPIVGLALANLIHCFNWKLPAGSNSIDMSDKFGIVVSRAQPLLVIPSPRLHPSFLSNEAI